MNFYFKNGVKINLRIITKNHAEYPEIGFFIKSISKQYGRATTMPPAWELKLEFDTVIYTIFIIILSVNRSWPGQNSVFKWYYRIDKVSEGVGNDNIVVATDENRNDNHSVTETFDDRYPIEGLDWALRAKLAQSNFEEKYRKPAEEEANYVRDQKSSTAIFVAQIGKTPNVPKAYSVANHRQQKLNFISPGLTLGIHLKIWFIKNE